MTVQASPRPAPGEPDPGLGDRGAPAGAEHFIDEVEHPAARAGQPGSMGVGRTIALVLVALLTATLLNSEGLLRSGEGMNPGITRTLTLAVARPVDGVAQALGLAAPRDALAAALGQEDLSGGEIVDDGAPPVVVPPEPAPGATPSPTAEPAAPEISIRTPTRGDPLDILVTGDSLSSYVGLQMINLGQDAGLIDVSLLERNGTGLTSPSYFNWQKAARSDMAKRDPEVVVMVIGGNDGWAMDVPGGGRAELGTEAWVQEYARRTAAVMRTYREGGRAVYWSGPPTARDEPRNALYRRINRAVAAAADAVDGARYIDLYNGTAVGGKYAMYVPNAQGRKVKSRQPDGIHWSLEGSVLPARLVLEEIEADAGVDLR